MRKILCLLIALLPGLAAAAERPLIPAQSEIAFTVTQMGVGVRGVFRAFTAALNLDPAKPEASYARIEVDIASIATGDAEADAEALKQPWLDAAGFPKARFASEAVHSLGGGRYEVRGTLDIKGRARALRVPVTVQEQADGTALASGEFALRRTDFGIGGGEWNEDDLVADTVPVRFRFTLGAPAP